MKRCAQIAACGLVCLGALAASGSAEAANSDRAYNLATRLGPLIEKCWIQSHDPTFADYIYSPEPNATNGPRILLVPRKNPAAPPSLVIEISKEGAHVSVYGSLATSPQAGRIEGDLQRWIAQGDSCS
jgi:hypothetical protein